MMDGETTRPAASEDQMQCKICGASAAHSNYGAKTCFACKMFFKRYGDKPNTVSEGRARSIAEDEGVLLSEESAMPLRRSM